MEITVTIKKNGFNFSAQLLSVSEAYEAAKAALEVIHKTRDQDSIRSKLDDVLCDLARINKGELLKSENAFYVLSRAIEETEEVD